VTSIVRRDTPQLVVGIAADSSLDQRLAKRHLKRLEESPAHSTLARLPTDTEEDLARALDPDDTDIVYFYTHCGYEDLGSGRADRFLTLGDMAVYAQNVNLWATLWNNLDHWSQRPPLVVLNGCHTTESTSGTLNNFVTAFTRWAGASGVLGSEITLEQGLAGHILEQVLTALTRGCTVGEALHEARWQLLSRGNLMGLAYTPYCPANLMFCHVPYG
jgi:hypothetical protein